MFILASSSPRRKDLLTAAGYVFEVIVPDVSEYEDPGGSAEDLTRSNAKLKGLTVSLDHPDRVVLGADTLVTIDGKVLSKPADMAEARSMLKQLSGRTHQVITSVVVLRRGSDKMFAVTTAVTFRPLTDEQIDHYLTLINPLDKAGAYAAQEHGEFIIESVEGSWTNVVGLPMEAVANYLETMGIPRPVAPATNDKSSQTPI